MKKSPFLISAAALLAACAGEGGKCLISGAASHAAEGDSVALTDNWGRQIAKVGIGPDGSFLITRDVDTARICTLSIVGAAADAPRRQQVMILEPGKVVATFAPDNDGNIGGIPSNDALQALRETRDALDEQLKEVYTLMKSDTISAEAAKALDAKGDSLYELYTAATVDVANAHIGSPLGIYALNRVAYGLNLEQLDTILAKVPVELTADPTATRLSQMLKAMKAVAVGNQFVDFEMETPDGTTRRLSDFAGQGKVVILDFWASWCGPCRRFAPTLVSLYDKYRGQGLEIVGVSLDSDSAAWVNAIGSLGLTWPQLSDLKGWRCSAAADYAVRSIPSTFIIGADGTILARNPKEEAYAAAIEEALARK